MWLLLRCCGVGVRWCLCAEQVRNISVIRRANRYCVYGDDRWLRVIRTRCSYRHHVTIRIEEIHVAVHAVVVVT